ncbi:HlyD family type I secretion periplasmic adaptor subunit [Paracoccus sediminis]|uniref:Membrane fusion protein (MFP) family protein n=1 Tax=Paracoccus sediminis TaxID=1214787 RepID=A0A238W6C9_9RHOB|nr:HlyD family type I secretion periplasmic adaptor subunit [Paracoccus sediminis]TBN51606.1 HlyD family type I secretion periplasmic adaptor subunit [Paracoccus sediminis]SNR41977.1 HlyD family secretion protein [Paracoccus sediminis]
MTVMTDDEIMPSYRPVLLTALAMILFLVCTVGGWGLYARLDGAVVTQGVVLAETRRKTVENLEGGILSDLLVVPGERVRAGQAVAQLDTTQERERLAQLDAERSAQVLDVWRLEAEAGGHPLDPALAPEGDAARIAAQVSLHDARLSLHRGQIASMMRQVEYLSAQAGANRAQVRAARRQIDSWTQERENTRVLVERGAATRQKMQEIGRNLAVLEGERDEYEALALANDRDGARILADIETLRQQRVAEANEFLAQARRTLPGLDAQIRATRDILARRTLRAPQDGLIVDIPVVTPGAVIGSGAVVMEIVPDADALVVQTRLPPEAIDTVQVGRTARVRLTAYRRAVAPTVDGKVVYVSADLLEDPRDGSRYFEARVALDAVDLDRNPDVSLTAGMPVEVAIQTGERRAGDYLLEPIMRHLRKAMREE